MTRPRRYTFLAMAFCLLLAACARDPDDQKQQFLNLGNEYFAKSKYPEASILYRKAIQLDGLFTEAYYRLALTYWETRNFGGVVWTCRRVWELDRDNLDAFRKLAETHFVALHSPTPARPRQTLESLMRLEEQAEARHPQAFEVLTVKGRLLLEQNSVDEAIPVLRRAHELDPGDEPTMLGLAIGLARAGRNAEARKVAMDYLAIKPRAAGVYDFLANLAIRQRRLDEAEAILRSRCQNLNDAESWLGLAHFYRGLGRDEDVGPVIGHILDNMDAFPDGRQLAGDFYLSSGDVERAIDYYRQGLEREPGRSTAYRERIVRAYLAAGDASRAQRELNALLESDPDHPMALEFLVYLATVSPDAGQRATALDQLHAALGRLPKNHLFRYYYGQALRAAGKHIEAKTQFLESIRLNPEFLPPKRALMDYYLRNGEFTQVQVLAHEILEEFPDDATARLALAAALSGLRDYDGSRRELTWLINSKQRQRDAIFQLAHVELAQKNYAEAKRLFRLLAEAHPPDPRGFGGLIETSLVSGGVEEARDLLDREIEKQTENLDLRLQAARLALAGGERDRAEQYLGRVLEQMPGNPEAHLYMALVVAGAGDPKGAKEHLRLAMDAEPPLAEPAFFYGTILLREGNYAESIPYFQRGLALQPDNPVALNNFAYALAETGRDLDLAVTCAQKAVSSEPHNPAYADTLGYAYIKSGLYENAIQILTQIVDQHPEQGAFRYHLGLAHYMNREPQRAGTELRAAQRENLPAEFEEPLAQLLRELGS